MRRIGVALAALAAIAVVLPGSGLASAQDGETAQLRVAHLSPDAPNVDVRVDGRIVLENVPFKTVSAYLEIAAGEHRIRVTATGGSVPVLIDTTVILDAGTAYTVAATGLLGKNDLRPLVLQDDRSTTANQAKVRVVHASPDAPAVDVAVADGSVLFSNVAFRNESGYATVDPATYDLQVRPAGTQDVALTVPGVTFEAATNYTVFAIGQLGNDTLEALRVVDAAGANEETTPPAPTPTNPGLSPGLTAFAVIVFLAALGVVLAIRLW